MTPPRKIDSDDMPIACQTCVLLAEVQQGKLKIEAGGYTDVWRWISAALGGALISALAFWLTLPANIVSRADMESYVQRNSPYAVDRALLISSLGDMKQDIKDIKLAIADIKSRQDRASSATEIQQNKGTR